MPVQINQVVLRDFPYTGALFGLIVGFGVDADFHVYSLGVFGWF